MGAGGASVLECCYTHVITGEEGDGEYGVISYIQYLPTYQYEKAVRTMRRVWLATCPHLHLNKQSDPNKPTKSCHFSYCAESSDHPKIRTGRQSVFSAADSVRKQCPREAAWCLLWARWGVESSKATRPVWQQWLVEYYIVWHSYMPVKL